MTNRKFTRESFPIVDGAPLRLSFSAAAILEHFDDDPDDVGDLDSLTDDELNRAGAIALRSDDLYAAFHEALVAAVKKVQTKEKKD
jgi:hypothetical protein